MTVNRSCDTGTSMATPGAAGTALLVRQYFIDPAGKFWRAVCNTGYRSCKSFTPSGPLIKAIFTHSGKKMSLFDGGGARLHPRIWPIKSISSSSIERMVNIL